MKIESRGKYPGVKVHLDPEECELLMNLAQDVALASAPVKDHIALASKMGKKILALREEEPTLLEERTPEQIKAILAKESEKARLQLEALNKGKGLKDLDPEALKAALLKHAK